MYTTVFHILEKVKREDVEKVGFSLKLPKDLKAKLDLFCHEADVSANSFIVALLYEILIKDFQDD